MGLKLIFVFNQHNVAFKWKGDIYVMRTSLMMREGWQCTDPWNQRRLY